jgi:5'-nucleotidase
VIADNGCEKFKMNVLLTNDDGFYAEGLQTLYRHLNQVSVVTIVAPDRERSAVGHGITMHQPLRVTSVTLPDDRRPHWAVNGTPADCVKIALDVLVKESIPDLIISGINRGANLGSDVLYSGTVSAALEGSLYRIPSIATSLVGSGNNNFNQAAVFIARNLKRLAVSARQTVLNINFPDLTSAGGGKFSNLFAGVKYTRLGRQVYENIFEERRDPRGRVYYWMGGDAVCCEQEADSDISAVEQSFISITPLHSDLTDYQRLTGIQAETNETTWEICESVMR